MKITIDLKNRLLKYNCKKKELKKCFTILKDIHKLNYNREAFKKFGFDKFHFSKNIIIVRKENIIKITEIK